MTDLLFEELVPPAAFEMGFDLEAWGEGLFEGAGASLFMDEELGELPVDHFSYVEPANETPRVDDEDFMDGAERAAFTLLKKTVRQACNVNTSPVERMAAAEWVFVPGKEDKKGLTFTLCCQALGIRDFVIQVRLQHQLYQSRIVYPRALPFLAVTIPPTLCAEILYYVGDRGLTVAKDIWDWPGFRADLLKQRHTETLLEYGAAMSVAEFDKALREMEANGFLGMANGFWFFTGRNPEMLSATRRRWFSWSREFV